MSKAKKYKIGTTIHNAIIILYSCYPHFKGAVYFTLTNIDPAVRSKLEVIYLVALFKSALLVEYSLNDVLKPFIGDLKKLSVSLLFV